jgi:hypothetical protein
MGGLRAKQREEFGTLLNYPRAGIGISTEKH